MDLYASLVPFISRFPGVRSVHVELPHDAELRALPCVDLQPAGPAGRTPALQGLGVDSVFIDVDLFVSPQMWLTGQAAALADNLRRYLSTYRDGMARAVDVGRPSRRPDRNPNIRRIGFTVEILTPA